jgi:hypothetical protein
MYIDPSNYGSPMEALMCTAEEIDRQKIELEKNIGGGKIHVAGELSNIYEFSGCRRVSYTLIVPLGDSLIDTIMTHDRINENAVEARSSFLLFV